MRFDEDHESPDLLDRRGEGAPIEAGGGIFWLLPLLIRNPVLLVVVLVIAGGVWLARGAFSGPTPRGVPTHNAQPTQGVAKSEAELVHFVSFVLDDVQATWDRELPAQTGMRYRHAKLVLFTDATRTACGVGESATGPFYCPSDERAYIDLGFYRQLAGRFGAKGDFAQAYVIAHEIGHHVQKIVGTSDRVHRAPRSQLEGANGLSVRLELQADCFAGIWAHSTAERKILDVGDVEEAIGAAQAIGDDRLQKQATGTVRPETWTHGSSAERVRWFTRGYEAGKMQACDTFAASAL